MIVAALWTGWVGTQEMEPVLWLRPDGKITVEGKQITPTINAGTTRVRALSGVGFDFAGPRSGINIPDLSQLALTESFTVSVWVNARSYVNDGPGAQLLFRGDDRNGHDPYRLVIHNDGTINFGVQTADDQGAHVTAELPLHRWHHVLASFEDSGNRNERRLRLYMNGNISAFRTTSFTPFDQLVRGESPGIGIGNIQNERGRHNQPFNGTLFDLRVYRGAWSPDQLDFGQAVPPKINGIAPNN